MVVTDDDIAAVTAGVQVNATAMAKAVRVAALALLQPVKPGQSSRTLPITPHQHPHEKIHPLCNVYSYEQHKSLKGTMALQTGIGVAQTVAPLFHFPKSQSQHNRQC